MQSTLNQPAAGEHNANKPDFAFFWLNTFCKTNENWDMIYPAAAETAFYTTAELHKVGPKSESVSRKWY